ncbi:MAG: hypothetical protein COV74_04670 [Candidatus Omnitrophica bacterium CG11_big_fil_rev_8_21_14_0_20_45_26]|uniref:CDP-alcohol phosphatidyltransferase n=1 Tax=Candidatus Abzuiibacterium crystallinum TaxID=1974748 RepID=A0A2H0LPV5_9BACT|nr:MAG: hypothetical protein COV74_04670 [Candidatus Omnitrophica bacterium CG11_big_fil_rev_8_21_14_0_20_45_26]PIW64056.1 MAG: hypothetical protein COW12_07795 [Candidatus Omnitrophica bacterium CG12_big_fil_rev_8_21_14_0_65_45_16]
MVTTQFKEFFNRLTAPVARCFVRLGVSPNLITLSGLIFGILACVDFARSQNVVRFVILITIFGLFDMLDGAVARAGGKETRFGAYLDAICDRLLEGFVILAVGVVTGEWVLLGFFLLGSLMVSYAKARAAMEVSVSNTEWPDLMERTERCVLFILGLLLAHIFQVQIAGHNLFYWTLMIANGLVFLTLLQRIKRAKTLIDLRS